MTDTTNAELIAENRKWLRLHQANSYQAEAARRMIRVLDALEAADQRAAELAAVVEKVRAWAGSHSGSTVSIIRSLLATAPADVLREVKADRDLSDAEVRDVLYFALRDAGEGRTVAEKLSRRLSAALLAAQEVRRG